MRVERAIRSNANETWYIISGRDEKVYRSLLLNVSETGGLFNLQEKMEIGSFVYVCPKINSFSGETPDPEMIKAHSNCLKGKVVRREGKTSYGIYFCEEEVTTSKKRVVNGDFEFEMIEKGYDLHILARGTPKLSQAYGFLSSVKNQAKRCLRIIVDFSDVEDFPLTALAVLRGEINKIMRSHRFVGLVNGDYFCKKYKFYQPYHGFLHNFISADEASDYLKNNPITVALIDDDPCSRILVEEFLSINQMKVLVAETGRDGIASVIQYMPNLILLDVHMPDMSGIEVAQRIQQHSGIAHIPIIMLTTDSSQSTVLKAQACNIQGYLLKPLDPLHFRRNLILSLTTSMCLRRAG